MADIDVKKELAKYQREVDDFVRQLQVVNNQRATLIQAIAERRGIIIYLQSLDQHKKETKEEKSGK